MNNIDTIVYHSNCRDGYCAFWQAKAKFPNAVGVAVNYGDPLPADEVIEGKDVLIADFSYPPEQMAVLAAKAKCHLSDGEAQRSESLAARMGLGRLSEVSSVFSGAYQALALNKNPKWVMESLVVKLSEAK